MTSNLVAAVTVAPSPVNENKGRKSGWIVSVGSCRSTVSQWIMKVDRVLLIERHRLLPQLQGLGNPQGVSHIRNLKQNVTLIDLIPLIFRKLMRFHGKMDLSYHSARFVEDGSFMSRMSWRRFLGKSFEHPEQNHLSFFPIVRAFANTKTSSPLKTSPKKRCDFQQDYQDYSFPLFWQQRFFHFLLLTAFEIIVSLFSVWIPVVKSNPKITVENVFFFVAPRSLATTAVWPKRAARCSGLVSSLSEASTEKPNVDKAWHPQKNNES